MEKVIKEAVLGFPKLGESLLLAPKRRHIGEGCLNGYGGGLEGEETPEAAMLREGEQECGIRIDETSLRKIAVVDFHNKKTDGETFTCRVHAYLFDRWEGNPQASDEMGESSAYPITSLPYESMMPADPFWLPPALFLPWPIHAVAWYGPKQKELLRAVHISQLIRL